jgi:peptidoglycan hydrolase-like protein with peptidoglycan-binding domain
MSREAPACRKALNDATRRWPSRDRRSDGIMGDARHQQHKSDHNLGNAVDVTHDPSVGCDGALIAALAQRDPRVTYVIFNRRIWSRARAAEGWRAYHGENPHNHHCHISIKAGSRDDLRDWAWVSATAGDVHGSPAPHDDKPTTPPPQVPAAPPRKVTHVEPYPGIELRRGARGLLVRRAQERLVVLRWDIRVDGDFGPATEASVRGVQRRHDLEVDGVIGRHTWRALFQG